MLEDCGNRPINDCEDCESDCPTKLKIIPAKLPGESSSLRWSVEISSKLGTITVPKRLRSKLHFSKGTYTLSKEPGFRDRVVRFTGFIPDVREALENLKYHTLQDENLQYKNQHTGRCSRACFLNDVGPPSFANAKEVTGCEQGCSPLIQ